MPIGINKPKFDLQQGLAEFYAPAECAASHIQTLVESSSSAMEALGGVAGDHTRLAPEITSGRILVVEDEPIVALDIQQELDGYGYHVVGLAESAEEALVAADEFRPDMALMDIRIIGSLNGIQAALLLRNLYQVPVIFLTSYSDESTVARAAEAMPYGYLIKPFHSRELHATLQVALQKAAEDASLRRAHQTVSSTIGCLPEGILTLSSAGKIEFMNAAAEQLCGVRFADVRGRHLSAAIDLRDSAAQCFELPLDLDAAPLEEFNCMLVRSGSPLIVDLSLSTLPNDSSENACYILLLRDATSRLCRQAIEESLQASRSFDQVPIGMIQIDEEGRIVRINDALLRESGLQSGQVVGRTLTSLTLDPDPRISEHFLRKILQGSAAVTPQQPRSIN